MLFIEKVWNDPFILERNTLRNLNVNYTIGEPNTFLQFIYLFDITGLTQIQPIYPDDEVLMSVVLRVFYQLTNLTSPKVDIMIIFNKTQGMLLKYIELLPKF